jgi:hypothetical protein
MVSYGAGKASGCPFKGLSNSSARVDKEALRVGDRPCTL